MNVFEAIMTRRSTRQFKDIPVEEEAAFTGYTDDAPQWLKPYLAAALRSGLTAGLPANESARDLMLSITRLAPALESALRTSSPNLICAYIYELAGAVNKFYHETRILTEEDEGLKAGYIALIGLAKNILETCIHILGFTAPEKM